MYIKGCTVFTHHFSSRLAGNVFGVCQEYSISQVLR